MTNLQSFIENINTQLERINLTFGIPFSKKIFNFMRKNWLPVSIFIISTLGFYKLYKFFTKTDRKNLQNEKEYKNDSQYY
jgi:hypothetical protein